MARQAGKIAIVIVMQYFHPVLEHRLPPGLKVNYNASSIFPSMARGTKVHFNFASA